MRPDAPPGSRTPVCWWLFVSWVAVHVTGLVLSGGVRAVPGPWYTWGGPTLAVLIRLGGVSAKLVELGDVHRLVTYGFVHAFVLHLVLNAWVFLAVGRLLESVVGSARLWIVFVVSVLGGGLAHLQFSPVLVVGASGGVFGVVGALGLWSLRSKHPQAKAARTTAFIFLLLSAALLFLPNVANDAHLGGLVAGVLVMAALGPQRSEGPAGVGVRAAAALLLVLVAGAGVMQALASPAGSGRETHAFLQDLRSAEGLADRLARRPDVAEPSERADLGRRLDDLLASPLLEDWPGAEAFGAYVEALRPVATGDIPEPWVFDAELEEARAAWLPWEERLRLGTGGAP